MTLHEYLTKRGMARSLAHSLGVSELTVYRWRYHKHMPSHSMIQRIEQETCGAVTPRDWYPSREAAE